MVHAGLIALETTVTQLIEEKNPKEMEERAALRSVWYLFSCMWKTIPHEKWVPPLYKINASEKLLDVISDSVGEPLLILKFHETYKTYKQVQFQWEMSPDNRYILAPIHCVYGYCFPTGNNKMRLSGIETISCHWIILQKWSITLKSVTVFIL